MNGVFTGIARWLRGAGKDANPAWQKGAPQELAYWEGVIRARVVEASFALPDHDYSWLCDQLGLMPGPDESLRLLDVGSGPFGTFRAAEPNARMEIVAADALGDTYNRMLDEFGLSGYPRIHPVKAENFSLVFGRDVFDLVLCGNALDHCENPAKAFGELIAVCKPGGLVHIISFENEGQWEGYHGLHHWNLRADSSGLWLSDRNLRSRNLFAPFRKNMTFRWRYLDHGQQFGRPLFEATMQKCTSS
jgi:SAM-dependent methyltransferase